MSSSSPSFARLTSTNYTTWSGDMEAWLKLQASGALFPAPGSARSSNHPLPVMTTLLSKSTTPSAAAAAQAELLEVKTLELQDAWDAKSGKAAGWIWLMLDQNQETLVDGCKDNPCAMWTKLESMYRQKKAGNYFNAYDDLFSI
ncbi:hypothetical protein EST38_g13096 [Candolleomyces aberdarensis]|uniref:DUF4219 domain-containing protein n=1 Tax=Candolleomyces aberdarensis TaxID=2316362 RepID=A0A4Q2D1I4_9AGAR|nr:hypothetical protein EST38_g13096 [Candolleomyces aberdarensis]